MVCGFEIEGGGFLSVCSSWSESFNKVRLFVSSSEGRLSVLRTHPSLPRLAGPPRFSAGHEKVEVGVEGYKKGVKTYTIVA